MAVLDLADRAMWQIQKIAQVQRDYDRGVRWDAQGNPLPGLSKEPKSYAGLKEAETAFIRNNPLTTEDEDRDWAGRFGATDEQMKRVMSLPQYDAGGGKGK